jgi:FkbM family methyltransferase
MQARTLLYVMYTLVAFSLRANQEQYYGQFAQDQWLEENIFQGKRNGVFVDVGAYDGVEGSNTYFFEKNRGWTGVCIEPQPDLFHELIKNRKAACVNSCVTNQEEIVQFLHVQGPAARQLSGIIDLYHPEHRRKIEGAVAYYGDPTAIINVKSRTLGDILKDYHITHVDYLSIDVEGAEMKVLEGIDFSACSFDVISIEVNYAWPELESFLKNKNFIYMATVGVDQIWLSHKFAQKILK